MKCRWSFRYEPAESFYCQILRDAGRHNHKCISVNENPYSCIYVNAQQYDKLYKLEQSLIDMKMDLQKGTRKRVDDEN